MSAVTGSRERRGGGNRRGSRVALEARALGRAFATRLYDLSPTGCRFDCTNSEVCRGDKIVFKFAEQIRVRGKIAWRRRNTAGVQFDAPLPGAIAKHLRFDASDES